MCAAKPALEATKDERLLLRKIVTRMIEGARPPLSDRRAELRTPYLWPARISPAEQTSAAPRKADDGLAAFGVDLSITGVGFVHQGDLVDNDVILTLHDDGQGQPLHIRTIIERTVARGDGWSLSGGRFIRKTRL